MLILSSAELQILQDEVTNHLILYIMKLTEFFILAAVLTVLMGSLVACGKEEMKLDSGLYVETYPVEGRTQINFIDGRKLSLFKYVDTDGSVSEHYYVINEEEDKIRLTLTGYPSRITYHYFKIITDSKFEISNLYFAPAVGAPIIMTFEKINN
jgi:hypothetical protein